MRQRLQAFCVTLYRWLRPKPNPLIESFRQQNADLSQALLELQVREQHQRAQFVERQHEMFEARQMAGSGPWLPMPVREGLDKPGKLRESQASWAAFSDLDLMLDTVEWRREINYQWLEFSRWGIQQIILISRLYFLKNPLIQRGVNVAASYVFGRGVEVGSPDETADRTLKDFFETNKTVLGQIALTDLERRKYYDGNLFFCFFPDKTATGSVQIRTIDATEIQDIVTNPDDTDQPWFYRRTWTERVFDAATGRTSTGTRELWYPALGYDDPARPDTINGIKVQWENPILHRRCGAISKWLFGCPLIYAAIDWARAAKDFLAACATVREALAQIAMKMTTKGGQQAIEGIKQQLQTQTGPPNTLWDRNPSAVNASTFVSGPGTTLEAFNTKGAGGDPGEVREYRNMVACVFGIPPTFLADMETANLATATSLDRPTELNFLEKQEAWREDLLTIAKYVLQISSGASGGRIREAKKQQFTIVEAPRRAVKTASGNTRWIMEASKDPRENTIEVTANFPAIIEGDVPQLVNATAVAFKTGVMDDKTAALQFYDLLPGIDDGVRIAEEQYPGTITDRQKQKADTAAALAAAPIQKNVKQTEALARRLVTAVAEESNGNAAHA
jgi:hypothetical protein